MSDDKILRAIGEIDAEYILEAEMNDSEMLAYDPAEVKSGEGSIDHRITMQEDAFTISKGKMDIACDGIICDFDMEAAAREGKERAKTLQDAANGMDSDQSTSDKKIKSGRFANWKTWQKWAGSIAAALVVCIIGFGTINFMPMGTGSTDSAAPEEAFEEYSYSTSSNSAMDLYSEKMMADEGSYEIDAPLMIEEEHAVPAENGVFEPYTLPEKIIYSANLYIQTLDFDETFDSISGLVDSNGGYIENSDVYNGSYGEENPFKSGYYYVRIPVDNYDVFIDAITDNCHVSNVSENQQNITEQYYETKERLESLYAKEDKLQELMKKAENMSDIIAIQSALSDNEYQIDNYAGQIRHYDSQVSYASVSISVETVSYLSGSLEKDGFFSKIGRAFVRGAEIFGDRVIDFILWFARNLLTILALAAVVFCIIRFHLIGKLIQRIKK